MGLKTGANRILRLHSRAQMALIIFFVEVLPGNCGGTESWEACLLGCPQVQGLLNWSCGSIRFWGSWMLVDLKGDSGTCVSGRPGLSIDGMVLAIWQ